MKLSEAETNALYKVLGVGGLCGGEARLKALGVCAGRKIKVLLSGGGVIIGAGTTVLGLSRGAAEKIRVKKI